MFRAPCNSEKYDLEPEIDKYVATIESVWPNETMNVIRESLQTDDVLKLVYCYAQLGWPSHKPSVAEPVQMNFHYRGH